MKNLFLLPTDKPSELYINSDGILAKSYDLWRGKSRHIYITNSEEIKLGDWVYSIWDKKIKRAIKDIKDALFLKKIILTTDQDLIKDGVQAIDNEFLEWFIKNPSCESVEVANDLKYFNVDELRERHLKGLPHLYSESIGYKIIIPKEEQNNKLYSEQYIYEKDLYNDKVEISVLALIEIKRAFGALIKDENSYLHKVFMDDYVHQALKELKNKYAEYFGEQIKDW
jgi:hypothetical protein